MTSRRPNLFLVGAPRCGTTSLHTHLSAHPEVHMSPIKELHYFSGDLYLPSPQATIADGASYLDMFSGASGERWVGEASPYYLYSRRAPDAIAAFSPDARIVVTLRNPADMMYSMYAFRARASIYLPREEPLDRFEDALAAEPERLRGRALPEGVPAEPGAGLYLCYRELARWADRVERWLTVFGPGAVHAVIFDDVRDDLPSAYRRLCDFLGIDARFDPGFALSPEARAAGARPRSRVLARLLWRPPAAGARTVRAVLPRPARRTLRGALQRWNDRRPPPLAPATRRRILDEARDDVIRLSELLGRDLTPWLDDRPVPSTRREEA